MPDGRAENDAALSELRTRLNEGLARVRLAKKDLAARTSLGRTTVQEAFQENGPVPSAVTVAALARGLRLPAAELLRLQRIAAGADESGTERGPGKPIHECNPFDLEVHQATSTDLPGYVPRLHDVILAQAVRDTIAGHSRMVVLVGSSSTGKTRACWEAVQPLAEAGWRLWHPFDPTRAEAALEDLQRVIARTVVWLNEAQHYLGAVQVGERIAAAVHSLLTDPARGPILVLGTLWPEYASQYTHLPQPKDPDPHSRVRELLAERTILVPETFSPEALHTAAVLADAGDKLLSDTLTRARASGRVAQDLAGAPALLRRYEHGTPTAKAVLEAAMDARRLGVGLHLPQTFLIEAAIDYLSDLEYDELTVNWAESAFAELARPVHGKQAPLRRTEPRSQRRPPGRPAPRTTQRPATGAVFLLADYLEQHGRTVRRAQCPPASFWHAAHDHLSHADVYQLAQAAHARCRLEWAHHLYQRAADAGNVDALMKIAQERESARDLAGAEAIYRRVIDAGSSKAPSELAGMLLRAGDLAGAEAVYRQAIDAGNSGVCWDLARLWERAGDLAGAEAVYRRAIDAGHGGWDSLADMWEKSGEYERAEAVAREAAEVGDTTALTYLAWLREEAGDREGAEKIFHEAVAAGSTEAMLDLAWMRHEAGDFNDSEMLYQRALDAGGIDALKSHAEWREQGSSPEEREEAATVYQHMLDAGNTSVLTRLAQLRCLTGNPEEAEPLYRRAIDAGDPEAWQSLAEFDAFYFEKEWVHALARELVEAGHTRALSDLAQLWKWNDDREEAEALFWEAVDAGDTSALSGLAEMRNEDGDRDGAETLYQRAIDEGDTYALASLARIREENGDRDGAETLYQRAIDEGHTRALEHLARIREENGDHDGAEILAQRMATVTGSIDALTALARRREQAGNSASAETLFRKAADVGSHKEDFVGRWSFGLDPDGTPTPPWSPA